MSEMHGWLDHLQGLGINVLLLGPVFTSRSHGYDILDPYHVDPRLGDNTTLQQVVEACHRRGIRVVLDAVFSHVSREFWAFRHLRQHLQASPYRAWFHRVSFQKRSRAGDAFSYLGWKGHYDLVKLKLSHPEVKAFQLGALEHWIRTFDIDGIRLDTADCLNTSFMKQVRQRAHRLKRDFWLMGEVVHGDYRRWLAPGLLDAVTNYSLYHALHTAHNAHNYHLLAQTLQAQFGPQGLYAHHWLYHFVDNHDVTRIASLLKNPAQLYPLYLLLYTLPGVPSLYYGSEWGQTGRKRRHSDAELRPRIPHPYAWQPKAHPDLLPVIAQLARLRQGFPVLQRGRWHLLSVSAETLVYLRERGEAQMVVMLNLSTQTQWVNLPTQGPGQWQDLLNHEIIAAKGNSLQCAVSPTWGRILLAG